MSEIRKVQAKLVRGLLDYVVLNLLTKEPIHGYKIIKTIRQRFGVYFGPSTIYPLLNTLEEKGHIQSRWNLNSKRPKKTYSLTKEGKTLLYATENSFVQIYRKLTTTELENPPINNIPFQNKNIGL